MKKKTKGRALFFLLPTLLLIAAPISFAQGQAFAPYASAGVVVDANTGHTNPDYSAALGIESDSKHVLLDLHGTIDTANPKSLVAGGTSGLLAGTGYTGTVTGSGYLKVLPHVLLGGGAFWSVSPSTFTSLNGSNLKSVLDATEQSAHPFLGGGFEFKRVRLLATYALPGKNALPNEQIVDFNTEVFITKHIRVTQFTEVNSYTSGGTGGVVVPGTSFRVAGTRVGVGLKLVL